MFIQAIGLLQLELPPSFFFPFALLFYPSSLLCKTPLPFLLNSAGFFWGDIDCAIV
jgi:hypothetical protein